MSTLRKLQREVIRNQCYKKNGNTKAFKKEWDDFHSRRTEVANVDGSVSSIRKKNNSKKRRRNDNGKVLMKQLKAMKSFISDMKDKAQNKTNTTKQKVV